MRVIRIRKELEAMMYDCDNHTDKIAVDIAVKKMLNIIKATRREYVKTTYNDGKYIKKPIENLIEEDVENI